MKIEGQETIPLPRADVWRGLDDPDVLKSCTPGLSRLDLTRPDHYEATLDLKLPAVQGRFEGHADVAERDEPARMLLKLAAKGGPGFVNGQVELTLSEVDVASTRVHYSADVQVGGTIARLGQRMISGVTKEMAGQFFEAFTPRMSRTASGGAAGGGGDVAPPTPPNAFLAALQLAWRTLLNLLGLSRRS